MCFGRVAALNSGRFESRGAKGQGLRTLDPMNIAKQYLARRGDVGALKLAAEQNMQFEPRAANSEAVASCLARLVGALLKCTP